MNKEQILGFVRHFLTLVGGMVVVRGWADESTMLEVVGAIVTLTGFVWSFLDKKA